jgi:hypothetical protein
MKKEPFIEKLFFHVPNEVSQATTRKWRVNGSIRDCATKERKTKNT